MREGDLSVRTGMKPNSGEIGELAFALDSLAASLQAREAENVRLIAEVESINSVLEERFNQRTEQLQRANRQLLISQQELRGLSQQLMRLTEQERTRISREIHDQLGQSLTAIKMELSNVKRKMATDPEEAAKRIEAATALANEMVILVRRIAANLRPGVLDDFGLAAAVDWHVADFCEKTGLKCDTDLDIDEALLNSNLSTSAYRITQEALTNIARHANASHVTIKGRIENGAFVIEIQDNGQGFVVDETRATSLGMLGMRERAAELGGTIEVTSEPGKGTKVRLMLPVGTALGNQSQEPTLGR
jgi:signal transduction histidine kinase